MTLRPLALAALLMAPLGASGQTPDSVRLGADTTQVAPDSLRRAQAAADSVRRADEAALDALVTRIDAVRESRAASQPWYVRWAWPLGLAVGAVVLLGAAVGIAEGLARRRAQKRHQRPATPDISAPKAEVPHPIRPPASAADLAALADRVQALETKRDSVRTPTAPPQVPSAPAPRMAASMSPADAAAMAFVEWCRTRGALASKRDLFATHLDEAVPGATVEAVYRDLDSPSRPVRFDGRGGVLPAEYWLVRAGQGRLLFPMPQGPSQFRDLGPVFEGQAVPTTLRSVTPAEVREDGGAYVLTQPGRVA